jgi:hypothetical protein
MKGLDGASLTDLVEGPLGEGGNKTSRKLGR